MSAASEPSTRGPYAKGVSRRQEILESALDLFAEGGFDGASLTAIGEAVGVSREGLRHYFSSREELLLAVTEAADARSHDIQLEDAGRRLIEIVAANAERSVQVPGLVSLYVSLVAAAAGSNNVVSREFFSRRFEKLRLEIVAAIEEGQRVGQVRADLPAASLAALLVGASDGLSMQWLLDSSIDIAGALRLLEGIMQPPSSVDR